MVRRALGASFHVECRHFALRVVARDVAKDREKAGRQLERVRQRRVRHDVFDLSCLVANSGLVDRAGIRSRGQGLWIELRLDDLQLVIQIASDAATVAAAESATRSRGAPILSPTRAAMWP